MMRKEIDLGGEEGEEKGGINGGQDPGGLKKRLCQKKRSVTITRKRALSSLG